MVNNPENKLGVGLVTRLHGS